MRKKIMSDRVCQEKESIKNTKHHTTDQIDQKRRTIVRKIAVGSAALAFCSVLPTKWTTPLVEFGSLPAHATTSGHDTETINLSGEIYIDGILRNKFVSHKYGPQYGKSMKIVFSSGRELYVSDTTKDVNTVPGRAYRPGGNYTYHKDVDKMEVYADIGDKSRYIIIHY